LKLLEVSFVDEAVVGAVVKEIDDSISILIILASISLSITWEI